MTFDIGIVFQNHPTQEDRTVSLLLLAKAYDLKLCLFSLRDVDLSAELPVTRAIYWDGRAFQTTQTTLPPICETCFFYRSKELDELRPVMDYIVEHCVLTEYDGLPKTQLSLILSSDPELARFSIPTFVISSFDELLSFSSIVKKAILKPSNGRQGLLVQRVDRINNALHFVDEGATREITRPVWEEYFNAVQEADFGIPVLQPRLDFRYSDTRAVDFRLLVQRSSTGEWKIVELYARIGVNGTVSNVSRGGFIADAESILSELFPERAQELYEQLKQLCYLLPSVIQKHLDRPISCLGIDVGIDRETEQPYILEANTLPGTKFFNWDLSHEKIQYFRYLLQQQSK